MNLDSVNMFPLQYSYLNILVHLSYLFVIYYKFLELELELELVLEMVLEMVVSYG